MEDLALKIMYTAIIICFCSTGVMKIYEFDELPLWASSSTVVVFFVSIVTALVSSMVVIWT